MNNNNTNSTILLLIVVVLLLLVGYVFWQSILPNLSSDTPGKTVSTSDSTEELPETPKVRSVGLEQAYDSLPRISGTIALSLQKTGTTASDPSLYLADVQRDPAELVKVILPNNPLSVGTEFIDGTDEYYVFTTSPATIEFENPYRIHKVSLVTGEGEPIVGEAEARNTRHLDWSESAGLLLYTKWTDGPDTAAGMLDLNNWQVAVYDPQTQIETILDQGANPMWSPSGEQFLYLKPDGVYLYDMQTNLSKKVRSVIGDNIVMSIESTLAISPDGTHLIWARPLNDQITVYSINSWDEFALNEVGMLQAPGTQYYWPTFSPDGNYYAVQAVERESRTSTPENARLEIRSTRNKNVIQTIPLKDYEFLSAFIDDWIK